MNLDDALANAFASMYASIVKQMKEAGVQSQAAFRLAGYLMIRESLGDAFVRDQLGVANRTLERWRAELRALDLTELPDLPDDFLTEMMRSIMGNLGGGGTE